MKNRIALLPMLVVAGVLAGCAGGLYVRTAPPPEVVEVRPVAPGVGAVWISGYWQWSSNDYHWVPGRWERHPRGVWVPGRWDRTDRGYHWVKGRWDQRGSRDRGRDRSRPLEKPGNDRNRHRDRGDY
jgi:hypothetical protein